MTLRYWINKIDLGWVYHISEGSYIHSVGWAFTLWGIKRKLKREIKNKWKRIAIKTGSSEYWYEYGELNTKKKKK